MFETMVTLLRINSLVLRALSDAGVSLQTLYIRLIDKFVHETECKHQDPYLLLYLSPLFANETDFLRRYKGALENDWREQIYLHLLPAFTEWHLKVARADHITLDDPATLSRPNEDTKPAVAPMPPLAEGVFM